MRPKRCGCRPGTLRQPQSRIAVGSRAPARPTVRGEGARPKRPWCPGPEPPGLAVAAGTLAHPDGPRHPQRRQPDAPWVSHAALGGRRAHSALRGGYLSRKGVRSESFRVGFQRRFPLKSLGRRGISPECDRGFICLSTECGSLQTRFPSRGSVRSFCGSPEPHLASPPRVEGAGLFPALPALRVLPAPAPPFRRCCSALVCKVAFHFTVASDLQASRPHGASASRRFADSSIRERREGEAGPWTRGRKWGADSPHKQPCCLRFPYSWGLSG